jgi:hypothetical protein
MLFPDKLLFKSIKIYKKISDRAFSTYRPSGKDPLKDRLKKRKKHLQKE